MNEPLPHSGVFRLLQSFCPVHLYEEIEGDLLQKYEKDVATSGKRRAGLRLWWNAVRFFRPGIIMRSKFSFELNRFDMLFNHLKFTVRLFWRDKFFSTLNLLGLSLGISVGIILLLTLQNDLTYDRHYQNHKNIYRVGCHQQQIGLDFRWARSAMDLGVVVKQEIPEIREIVRVDNNWGRKLVKIKNPDGLREAYETGIADTDTSYFQVFTHKFIKGDPSTCLRRPYSAVMTRTTSRKYFGAADPIGNTFTLEGDQWTVTAVIEDIPENTHLKFNLLLTNIQWTAKQKIRSENFWNPGVYLYVLTADGFKVEDFYRKFPGLYDKYFKEFGREVGGKYEPILEPLTDIHFHSTLEQDEPHGNIAYLYGFTAIGILILLLSCINYMNLSTAKSITRATEISVKKLVGSSQGTMVFSFLAESMLLSMGSLLLSFLMVYVILDLTSFNELIGKNIRLDWDNPDLLWGSVAIAMVVGFISGLYPAFYLASHPTLSLLKGKFKGNSSARFLRKALITFQFSISGFAVLCAWFMTDQIEFVRHKGLGFNKENIVVIPIQDTLVERKIPEIRRDLLANVHIRAAATSHALMGVHAIGLNNFWVESKEGMKQMGFITLYVGDDFINTLGIQIIQGTDFKPGPANGPDTEYIMNETAVKQLTWGDKAVGKRLKFFHGEIPGKVVGVAKDFNHRSLHGGIEPMLIVRTKEENGFLHVKVDGEDIPGTLSLIKERMNFYDPGHPFSYSFMDQRFDEQYKGDENQSRLLSGLAAVCAFISLLGLIGLSAFTATQRTSEIAVRKVLGAHTSGIVWLLTRDILILVVVAVVLTIPVSQWTMTVWLQKFAYRRELDNFRYPLLFSVAVVSVFVTILIQSIKVLRSNPVDSLKYE